MVGGGRDDKPLAPSTSLFGSQRIKLQLRTCRMLLEDGHHDDVLVRSLRREVLLRGAGVVFGAFIRLSVRISFRRCLVLTFWG